LWDAQGGRALALWDAQGGRALALFSVFRRPAGPRGLGQRENCRSVGESVTHCEQLHNFRRKRKL
jgi:hypothetical protein